MNTPNIPPTLPLTRIEDPQGSLDERIARAEHRLVTREQALRHGFQALMQRAQKATEPRRMVRPAVYALGALALVWGVVRLLRRRRGTEAPGTSAASAAARSSVSSSAPLAAPPASRFGEVPWVQAAALLWPLLPAAWRGRVGPDTASTLVALSLPLAGLLFGRRAHPPSPSQRSA